MIPIILQANYKPEYVKLSFKISKHNKERIFYSGWLGLVVGTKLYINYTKKSFEAAYSDTLAEVRAAINKMEIKPITPASKKGKFLFIFPKSLFLFIINIFSVAPVPAPQPSSTITTTTARTNEVPRSTASSPPNSVVHLISQFRIDKQPAPIPVSLAILEKMSITDTQHLLAENGLEK